MNDLEYEPLTENHAEDLITLWGDEDVIYYTNIPEPSSLSQIMQRICCLIHYDVFVVRHKREVAGVVGCPCINKYNKEYGVFYHFKKKFWNKGIASQSMKWLLNYMKTTYPSATLYADVVANNIASEKILKNFGFSFISSDENGFERNGTKMTVRIYRLQV